MLDQLAVYPALIESEECSSDLVPVQGHVMDSWRRVIAGNFDRIYSAIERVNPMGVLLVQGYEPQDAALRAAAILAEVPSVAIENTSRSDRILWDNIACYACTDNLAKNYYFRYRNLVREEDVERFKDEFNTTLVSRKSEQHQSGVNTLSVSPSYVASDYVLFLGQVFTDAATIFCLGDWSSPLQMLESLADWCIENKRRLVVKLHPKEQCGTAPVTGAPYRRLTHRKINDKVSLREKLSQCEAVIDYDNTLDTVKLIRNAGMVVTVTSQAGLEAAMLGKAVVVGGRASYSGLGFTYDTPNPLYFNAQLNVAWSRRDIDHSTAASRFGYIYFEKYCIPKDESHLADLCLKALSK